MKEKLISKPPVIPAPQVPKSRAFQDVIASMSSRNKNPHSTEKAPESRKNLAYDDYHGATGLQGRFQLGDFKSVSNSGDHRVLLGSSNNPLREKIVTSRKSHGPPTGLNRDANREAVPARSTNLRAETGTRSQTLQRS